MTQLSTNRADQMTTEIEELFAKATPRPWQAEGEINPGDLPRPWIGRIAENRFAALACGDTEEQSRANGDLIVHAVNNIERLISDNEAQREALERIAVLTPSRANAKTAMALHWTVSAIAKSALDRPDAALSWKGEGE